MFFIFSILKHISRAFYSNYDCFPASFVKIYRQGAYAGFITKDAWKEVSEEVSEHRSKP